MNRPRVRWRLHRWLGCLSLMLVLAGCDQAGISAELNAASPAPAASSTTVATTAAHSASANSASGASTTTPASATSASAVFAGGCFWCMEPPYDKLAGVISTTSGYTGGHTVNPTYRQVSAGGTGHAEAVRVVYDPRQVSYTKLLDVFWHNVDPLAQGRQFCDVGDQYRSAIFPAGPEQERAAQASKRALGLGCASAAMNACTMRSFGKLHCFECAH